MLYKCKMINYFPCCLTENLYEVTCLMCVHKAAESLCHPTPPITLFQVNNGYETPRCFSRWPHHSAANRPLTHANKGRPSENASAGSHSHPDNISIPPAPHALTWSSHTDRVANGHFYESKQGGWDTGHPPSGRLVLPLIDRYLILDGDSGVLSRAGHRSRWYVWELCGGHEGAPAKWPFRPIPPAPCPLLGIYIQFPSQMAKQWRSTEVGYSLFRKGVA